MNIEKWIWDCLTEDDGEAICGAKVLAAIAFFSYPGYSGYGLYTRYFSMTEFANGLMVVLIGCASIIAGSSSPKPSEFSCPTATQRTLALFCL